MLKEAQTSCVILGLGPIHLSQSNDPRRLDMIESRYSMPTVRLNWNYLLVLLIQPRLVISLKYMHCRSPDM